MLAVAPAEAVAVRKSCWSRSWVLGQGPLATVRLLPTIRR